MSKWHDFISHEKKMELGGVYQLLLMHCQDSLMGWWIYYSSLFGWIVVAFTGYWAAELKTKKNVLNQNIQAGQNHSEPGKQKQICSLLLMLDGFFEKMQISTQ